MTALILAAVLTQPWPYNPFRPPIISRQDGAALSSKPQYAIDCDSASMSCSVDGGVLRLASMGGSGSSDGGAPINATYITQTASSALTNEQALSSLSTGLVKVTTGTGVLSTAAAGTDYAAPTSGTSVLLGNGTGGFSSYAGTSCTNQFPRSLSAAGAATCASVALNADVTNKLGVVNGGTGLNSVAANDVLVGTAVDTLTAKSLPSCSNATTSKLLYDSATQTWSCGTDQTNTASPIVRRTLTTGYTGTGTGTTAVAMPLFTWDAGATGWNAIIDCELMTITDGGTGNGIRFNVSNASATATEVRRHFQYCSSATAIATINNGTGFGTHAPTASQGGVPCRNRLRVSVRNVTAIGQVQFYLYSELASPAQVTVLPGSYCDYSGW